MTSKSGSIARYTVMNLAGLGLPLVAAVFTIPVLIRHLGAERFGLLALIWAVVGYVGLFDFGLGRALTQQMSVLLARGEDHALGSLVATSLAIMAGLGLVGGVLFWFGAAPGVGLVRGVTDPGDAVDAMRVMAFAVPFVVITSGLRGILEARFQFSALNLIRLPMGLLTFIGPAAVVLFWSTRLADVALVLGLGRVLACFVYAWYARRDLQFRDFSRRDLGPLVTAGGWMSVSNIVSPLDGVRRSFHHWRYPVGERRGLLHDPQRDDHENLGSSPER